MTIEQLVQVLRNQEYILDLSSTHVGAEARYSARFFHRVEAKCDECSCNLPNEWDAYAHAYTIEEAVLKAAQELGDRRPAILVNMGEPPLGLENKPVNIGASI